MGLLDFLKKKDEAQEEGTPKSAQPPKSPEESKPEGKYNEECALCGKTGTDKKWAGQYWHVKCQRQGKKLAKKMV